jgi:hypothetical protein
MAWWEGKSHSEVKAILDERIRTEFAPLSAVDELYLRAMGYTYDFTIRSILQQRYEETGIKGLDEGFRKSCRNDLAGKIQRAWRKRSPVRAVKKIQKAYRAFKQHWARLIKEHKEDEAVGKEGNFTKAPKIEEEEVRLPLEMVPHISYAIVNVFENYYQDELKDFQEGVEEEWTEEIFKRKFENHMVYSLLTMRFGEEEARNEMKGLWDHQCKVWEYNSD